jgi:hypothetical protein
MSGFVIRAFAPRDREDVIALHWTLNRGLDQRFGFELHAIEMVKRLR